MKRRNARRGGVHRQGVALKAKHVDLGAPEQARVGRPVRLMAGHAAFGFYRYVLEDERARLVNVALEADGVLRSGGPQLPRKKAPMHVVTVGALQESLIDAVPERLGKIGSHFLVAAVTELRLGCLK
jgi:hypothetical protein